MQSHVAAPLSLSGLPPGVPMMELIGVSKRYPGVVANDQVSFRVMPGEIHAVIGENGAGKSTLMKIIYGAVRPDEGQITWRGREVDFAAPTVTRSRGIGMVFQHFSLFESLTVLDNMTLCLGDTMTKGMILNQGKELAARYGMSFEPERRVSSLSMGERQQVEIIRCLLSDPKLLILDEPTSVLSPHAAEALFVTLRQLAREGRSILYISHKLDEVKRLCHKATVLRNGRVTASEDMSDLQVSDLAVLMTGSELPSYKREVRVQSGRVLLSVHALSSSPRTNGDVALTDISFELRAGEILGIAGVSGSGQRELMDFISGERLAARADQVAFAAWPIGMSSVEERRGLGMAYVPEERLGHGAVPDMSLLENFLLSQTGAAGGRFVKHGVIDVKRLFQKAESVIDSFKVKTAGSDAPAASLSGGNLQKFIVGRELEKDPEVLVVAQPTWGVDIASAMFIRQKLIELAEQGKAVLVTSEDLDELLQVCDRIMVMAQGRLSPAVDVASISAEQLGLWMGGVFEAQGTLKAVAV